MIAAVEDYLEKCAQVIVKIDLVESLLMPENLEVSSRNVLKHANYGVAISSSSSAQQKSRITSLQAEDDGWKVRGETMRGRRVGETSGTTLGIKEQGKSSAVSQQHQQSSSSARKEEDHWELRVDKRRRRIAFENLAKSMLRYFDNCNEVKVGITELQERVEVPEQIGISIQQVARQAMNEDGQTFIFSKLASWARWEAQRKGLVDLERKCQDISREIQMLNKRQDIFQSAIEGKLRVQDTASERLQDQIMDEVKELESTKTE